MEFFLPAVDANRGDVLDLPFQLRSDTPLSMISWSVEYDTEVFEFIEPVLTPSTAALLDSHSSEESLFAWFEEPQVQELRFEAQPGIRGEQMVPPVESTGQGRVRFDLEEEGLRYRLQLESIQGVTEAWLHLGGAEQEGPGVALLVAFPGAGRDVGGRDTIAEGLLTDDDLLPGGGFDGTLVSLAEAMQAGGAYVVVQTVRHPTGEIRGQLGETLSDDQESWLQVAVVTDFLGRPQFSIPADELVTLTHLRFRVREDAPEGNHELEFSLEEEATFNGNFRDGERIVFNIVGASGQEIDEINFTLGSFPAEVTNGSVLLSIIGDVQILNVGDANHDGDVDISDPVTILYYLFVDSSSVTCLAAIDTNDDGSINISDAIVLLRGLFSVSTVVWGIEPISTTRAVKPGPECF